MPSRDDVFARHQQKRWLRPDAARWVRGDISRYLRPGCDLAKAVPAIGRKYNADQPRVPAGSGRESGQWTDGSGVNDTGIQYAQNEGGNYPVDLLEERDLGGHAIERHVGKSKQTLLNSLSDTIASAVKKGDIASGLSESSFSSLEAANKLVNAAIAQNRDKVDLVANGTLPRADLDGTFYAPTGYEAYVRTERSQPYIRDTYGVRVVVVRDRNVSKGYRVDTAFPTYDR